MNIHSKTKSICAEKIYLSSNTKFVAISCTLNIWQHGKVELCFQYVLLLYTFSDVASYLVVLHLKRQLTYSYIYFWVLFVFLSQFLIKIKLFHIVWSIIAKIIDNFVRRPISALALWFYEILDFCDEPNESY